MSLFGYALPKLLHNPLLLLYKTVSPPLYTLNQLAAGLHTTSTLHKNPNKKKKNTGNELMRMREERKLFRISKELKKSKDKDRILKPIDECKLDPAIENDMENRLRPKIVLNFEEEERRALLLKEWARYNKKVHQLEKYRLKIMLTKQQRALEELKLESEFLYNEAVKLDDDVVSMDEKGNPKVSFEGPKESAPIDDYLAPDGSYAKVDKNWNVDPCPITEKQRYLLSESYLVFEARRVAKSGRK